MLYRRGQIAIEFVVVYAIILLIFALVFSVVTSQRAIAINSQQQQLMQIQASEIAYYINQAIGAGSGYSIVVPLTSGITSVTYNLTMSATGVVQISGSAGGLPIQAYAFSAGRGMIINGSLLSYSANGINVYSVPTYTGSLNISNYGGIIYINSRPVSTVGLLANPIIQSTEENYVPYFNGANSMIFFPYTTLSGRMSGLAGNGLIVLWIKRSSPTQTGDLIAKFESSPTNYFDIGVGLGCGSTNLAIYNGISTTCLGGIPADTNWHQLAIVFNSLGEYLYVDGVKQSQAGPTAISWGSQQRLQFGIGTSPTFNAPFGGFIADVAIYNSSLTTSQITAAYKAGIFGAPVSNNTVAGWWPLENNAYDYSGNSYDGQYDNISFQNAAEMIVYLSTHSGAPLVNVPVGFVASNAVVGASGFSGVVESGGVGTARGEIIYNTVNPNVTVYGFDGNSSTANYLVGWWPLSYGSIEGSTAYDLSGYSNNAMASFLSWLPQTQQTNFAAARFPGDSNNIQSNSQADGFITVNNTGSLFNVSRTGNFTLVAWVKYGGGSPSHCEGIFGGGGNATTGFQLMGYGDGGSCKLFYGGGYNVSWPSGTYNTPLNRWVMLTAEYDQGFLVSSYNAPMYVYLNGTLFSTYASSTNPNRVFVSTSPVNNTYYIGDDAWDPLGLDSYNGLISDVQLYSTFLTQSQINTLYKEGPTSIPLAGAQIDGWWPLDGNANDSSGYANQGLINYNVTFKNTAYNYTIGQPNQFQKIASFSNSANILVPTSNSMNTAGSFSVSLWVSSYLTYSTPFVSKLFYAQQSGDGGSQIQLCGAGLCGITGLYANVGSTSASLATGSYAFNFAQNTWYHVVLTAGGGAWKLYLNGQPVTSGTYNGIASLNANTLVQIGGGSGGPGGSVDQIADVQAYNTILTPAQVEQLYQQGIPTQQTLALTTG